MKKSKLPIIALALVLFVSSCKKSDQTGVTAAEPVSKKAAPTTQLLDSTNWHSSTQWQSAKRDDYSVYYFNIADAKITSDVANDGMVLVYKKNANTAVAMPYEDKTQSSSSYWYYEVTEGKVLILCDAYAGAAQPGAETGFKYYVLTSAQLKTLEANGHTRSNLMDMTYAQAANLLTPLK